MAKHTIQIADPHPTNPSAPWMECFRPKRTVGRIQRIPQANKLTMRLKSWEERIRVDRWTNLHPKADVRLLLQRRYSLLLWLGGVNATPTEEWQCIVTAFDLSDVRWHLFPNTTSVVGPDGKPLPHELSIDTTQVWNGYPSTFRPGTALREYTDAQGNKHLLEEFELGINAEFVVQTWTRDQYPEMFADLSGAGPVRVNARLDPPQTIPPYTPGHMHGFSSWYQPMAEWYAMQQFSGYAPAVKATIELELS